MTARLFFARLAFIVALEAKASVVEEKDAEEPAPVVDDALLLAA